MTCTPCAIVTQYAYNLALWADLTGSTLLGGYPRDTISLRIARARLAGERWASVACAILTFIGTHVFRQDRDHCTWTLAPGDTIGAEIWHWSPPDPGASP